MLLAEIAVAIFILNLPFGYWRSGLKKFTPLWFVAIHMPVPLAVGLRLAVGIPFRLLTLPLFVAAFFGGQWVGGMLKKREKGEGEGDGEVM